MQFVKTRSSSIADIVLSYMQSSTLCEDELAGRTILISYINLRSQGGLRIWDDERQRNAWVISHKVDGGIVVWLAGPGEYDFDHIAMPNYGKKSHQLWFPWERPHEAAEAILNFLAYQKLPQQKEENK